MIISYITPIYTTPDSFNTGSHQMYNILYSIHLNIDHVYKYGREGLKEKSNQMWST